MRKTQYACARGMESQTNEMLSISTAFCFETSEISKDGSWGVDTEVRTFAIICNTTVYNIYTADKV